MNMRTISAYEARINFGELLNEVYYRDEEIIVERKGRPMVKISKVEKPKTEIDLKAFRASAGAWKNIDTDTFLVNTYKSRKKSSRPQVKL